MTLCSIVDGYQSSILSVLVLQRKYVPERTVTQNSVTGVGVSYIDGRKTGSGTPSGKELLEWRTARSIAKYT